MYLYSQIYPSNTVLSLRTQTYSWRSIQNPNFGEWVKSHFRGITRAWYMKVYLWICNVVFQASSLEKVSQGHLCAAMEWKGKLFGSSLCQQNHWNPSPWISFPERNTFQISHQDVFSSPGPSTSSFGFQISGSGSSSAPMGASSLLLLSVVPLNIAHCHHHWLGAASAFCRNIRVGTEGTRKCPPSLALNFMVTFRHSLASRILGVLYPSSLLRKMAKS